MSLSDAFAGLFAGCINDLVLYAPDTMKYLQQNGKPIRPLKSVADFRFYYRGSPSIVFGGGLSYATFFYTYGLLKRLINESPLMQSISSDSVLGKFIISGLAGSLAIFPTTLVGYPFDTMKKHLALLPDRTPRQVAQDILSTSGVKGFFFGWNYTIARDVYSAAVKMASYELTSQLVVKYRDHPHYPSWLRNQAADVDEHERNLAAGVDEAAARQASTFESYVLNSAEVALIGTVSGLSTCVLSMPIDCVVSRMRSPLTPPEIKRNFLTCAKWMTVQDQHLIRPFFRGTAVRSFNYAVGSSVFWVLFNKAQHFYVRNVDGAQHQHKSAQ